MALPPKHAQLMRQVAEHVGASRALMRHVLSDSPEALTETIRKTYLQVRKAKECLRRASRASRRFLIH